MEVNEARKETQKSENLPPTLAALEQHIKEELNGNHAVWNFQKQQVALKRTALYFCSGDCLLLINLLLKDLIKGRLILLEDEPAPHRRMWAIFSYKKSQIYEYH